MYRLFSYVSYNYFTYFTVVADKPKYEVGSAATLSFGKKLAEQKAKVAAVWTISNDDEDDEAEAIIDADDLLDEEDLAKPDPSSNRGECVRNRLR